MYSMQSSMQSSTGTTASGPAEYDGATGAPLNTAAMKEVAQEWRTGLQRREGAGLPAGEGGQAGRGSGASEAGAAAGTEFSETAPESDAGGATVKARVVQLQYDVLATAAAGFDEFNMIGGGASCAVYTARVFGVPVAIKRLEAGAIEWETKHSRPRWMSSAKVRVVLVQS